MLAIKPLSVELQKVAIEELDEVPSRIPEDLKALKDWLATQSHLKARTDDQFLIQFLRCCKYDMVKAKALMDTYFSLTTKYPEVHTATPVDDVTFCIVRKWGILMALPIPLHGNGPRIMVLQFHSPTEGYSVEDVFLAITAMHESLVMNDPYACIHGIIYVVDYARASLRHYQQITPEFCKKLMSFLESVPLHIKSINYIHMGGAPQEIFNTVFSSYSEEMRKKILVAQDNLDEMLKIIPLKYLPRDFGGEQPSLLELAENYDEACNAKR